MLLRGKSRRSGTTARPCGALSGLRFPQARISRDEAGGSGLEKGRVAEPRRPVPIRAFIPPLVPLKQDVEGTGRNVQPCDGHVCRLTDVESDAAQLEQVGTRSEAEIEIEAVPQVRDDLSIEGPDSSGRSLDLEVDRVRAEPAADPSLSRAPRVITRDVIREPRGSSVLAKDGGAVDLPARLAFLEVTGVMPGSVEASPQDRGRGQSKPPTASSAIRPSNVVPWVEGKPRTPRRARPSAEGRHPTPAPPAIRIRTPSWAGP